MDAETITEKWNEILKKTVAENPALSVTSTEFAEAFCENTSQKQEDEFHWWRSVTEHLWDKLQEDEKKRKLDLIYFLMAKCDMYNGKISDMTYDEVCDSWYIEDLDDIIKLGKDACKAHWRMRTNAY